MMTLSRVISPLLPLGMLRSMIPLLFSAGIERRGGSPAAGPTTPLPGGAFLSMPCLCSRFPASGRAIGGERTIRAARLKCLKHSYRSPYEIPRFQKFQPPLQSGPTPVIPTTPRQSHFVPSSAQVALAEGERLFSSPEEVRQQDVQQRSRLSFLPSSPTHGGRCRNLYETLCGQSFIRCRGERSV